MPLQLILLQEGQEDGQMVVPSSSTNPVVTSEALPQPQIQTTPKPTVINLGNKTATGGIQILNTSPSGQLQVCAMLCFHEYLPFEITLHLVVAF